MTPIKDETGRVVKFVGVQVDVTSKTEGTAVKDSEGVPVLIHYDGRWVVPGGAGGGGAWGGVAGWRAGPCSLEDGRWAVPGWGWMVGF